MSLVCVARPLWPILSLVLIVSCASPAVERPQVAARCRMVSATAAAAADTVHWLLAADSSDAAALDAWCSDVGPAVVRQPPLRAPTDLDSIAVVSWNLHVGDGRIASFVADLRRGRLTGGAPVRDFVILAQEARRGGPGDIVVAAADLGVGLYYVPAMPNAAGDRAPDDRGNAILSTLPLDDLEAVELPVSRQRRVAALATVRLRDDVVVRLVNVHLENRTGGLIPDARTSGAARLEQIRALLRTATVEGPTVLAGDLNTWVSETAEPVIEELVEEQGFAYTPLPPDEPTLAAGLGLFTRRLDYVFFRLPDGWSGTSRRIADRYGSDHYPLVAWVRAAAEGRRRRRICGRRASSAGV